MQQFRCILAAKTTGIGIKEISLMRFDRTKRMIIEQNLWYLDIFGIRLFYMGLICISLISIPNGVMGRQESEAPELLIAILQDFIGK